jgi:hypothetical protein
MATLKAPVVTCVWKVANLERNTQDGRVLTVHYTVAATDDTYAASAYGSIGLNGDVTTPYADLTEDQIIGWVKDSFGDEKVAEIEEALQTQLDEQHTPTKAAGLPW